MSHITMEGGMKSVRFTNFLSTLSGLCQPDCAFIFDNAPAHRSAVGQQGPNLRNDQILRPLPRYSPMLNIVENAICTFKAALKRDLEEARPNLIAMSHDEQYGRP